MKRILAVLCVVGGLAVAQSAQAQITTAPNYTLTTVDGIARRASTQLLLTGVVEGAGVPTEIQLDVNASSGPQTLDACERFATAMMSRPGQYRLEVWNRASGVLSFCRLIKLNP